MRHHLLERDLVLHQQANLDVHQVEVVLQPLVGADVGHHLLAQAHHLQLLLEVLVAVVQQVDELPHHSHRGVLGADCREGEEEEEKAKEREEEGDQLEEEEDGEEEEEKKHEDEKEREEEDELEKREEEEERNDEELEEGEK